MASKISRPGGETPLRSGSAAGTGDRRVSIRRMQVVNVDSRNFTVDVRAESYPFNGHYDIPFMSPYVNQAQGEGINFLPEVGSTCWVCSPSENGKDSFVIGWAPVQESGSYRGGRELLNPGDLYFSTRDGNFLAIRRGGVVQIGATPICQRIFIPIRNIVRDLAENYELSTPAGDLSWTVNRTEEQGDGHRGCLFQLEAKEFSDDPNNNPLATLKMGSHGEGKDTILTIETRDKGGGTVQTSLTISKSGKVSWSMTSDFDLEVDGDFNTTVKGKMTTTSTGDMSFETQGSLSAKGAAVHASGGGATMDLQATVASLNGSSVNLGDAIGPVMIETGNFAAWAAAVTALLSATPGSPAIQAILPPLSAYLSTKAKA